MSKSGDTKCQCPGCDEKPTETYTDPVGNELELCEEDYFEAVYPPTRIHSIRRRSGDDDERPGGLLSMLR